jgi:integrase
VLQPDEAAAIFDAIDAATLIGKRDRAMLAVMLFGFARVGAVVRMRVRDFEDSSREAMLIVHEKGGNVRRIPCHHRTREYLHDYIAAAGFIDPRDAAPLFQSARGWTAAFTGKAIHRRDA